MEGLVTDSYVPTLEEVQMSIFGHEDGGGNLLRNIETFLKKQNGATCHKFVNMNCVISYRVISVV